MAAETKIVTPGPQDRQVRDAKGRITRVPDSWDLLPPGDAAITRKVKAETASWTVQVKRGRRTVSEGVWADAQVIERVRKEVLAKRKTPAAKKKLSSDRARRAKKEEEYAGDFTGAVKDFLAFPERHQALSERLSAAVAAHSTPVGSGTVARTQRIPIEERAEAAVIAWLRHNTTGYDDMEVPNEKGARRELRRELAARSRELLQAYRAGSAPRPCYLTRALVRSKPAPSSQQSED